MPFSILFLTLKLITLFCLEKILKINKNKEETEQLLREKSSKSTEKATHNAVKTLRDFCKEQNLDKSFQELSKTVLF